MSLAIQAIESSNYTNEQSLLGDRLRTSTICLLMKVNRSGQAQIIDDVQLDKLAAAMPAGPHRIACLLTRYTACRISECLALRWGYIANGVVVFPGSITKSGKTREVDIHPRLSCAIDQWRTEWSDYRLNGKPIHERVDIAPGALPGADHFLFPGLGFATQMKRQSYDRVLKRTLQELGIKGASSHSMRRSSLTKLADAGTPLRHIMEVSGHQSLDVLSRYLGSTPKQRRAAINAL